MTPGARIAAAIEILDRIKEGSPAERALIAWARNSRFAGSKDRAAVRDHVFDVLRARRSLGDGDGRALMIALALREGWDVPALFSGQGHAPSPLTDGEAVLPAPDVAAFDISDWLWPQWTESLGPQAATVARIQQARAGVFVRVNFRRTRLDAAQDALAEEDIVTVSHPKVKTALEVTENHRKVRLSKPYSNGLIELQDPSSQAAVAHVPVPSGARLLDYCAGGGGKALAFADLHDCQVFAHDIAPDRMADLPVRAARADVTVQLLNSDDLAAHAPFDVVFCDAPCSGSGTWRRSPDAKWRLTAEDLAQLNHTQSEVITKGATLTAPDGLLAYATCSVLSSENDQVVSDFLQADANWMKVGEYRWLPSAEGDGFYLSLLRRREAT
ncbi:RsmB/NOP family class I SAM-dependent RNA methyltransferase [Yoonia sp. 2307UL14-13]|uniref:RsmB/NOP family class I SAM-dependent RNA methyltransferase n=1 Tax=Yoonia sp. 2307UL14-13 TaxID=3126506 RepID=UPI00309513EB